MKKTLSIILAVLMIVSCVPIFASAAISLTRNNVEIIPPTVSPTTINYGTPLSEVTLNGGKLWYIDPDTGAKTEVAGHFVWASPTQVPAVNEAYKPTSMKFIPDDTETYGTTSSTISRLATIVSGEWPTITVLGKNATIVEAPTVTVYATENMSRAKYSGGKVVDDDGKNITSSGSFKYIGETEVYNAPATIDIQWKGTGYEVTTGTAELTVLTTKLSFMNSTWQTSVAVNPGTTYAEAMAQVTTPRVLLTCGSNTYSDSKSTYWTYTPPAGISDDTVLTDDITVTGVYEREGCSPALTYKLIIDVLKAPAAVINEMPTIDATDLNVGQKASDIILTGGSADVAGKFVVTNPDMVLVEGENTIDITFVPDDLTANDCAYSSIKISIKDYIRFVDENGNDTIPHVTAIYDTIFGETSSMSIDIHGYLNCKKSDMVFFDAEGNSLNGTLVPMGTNEITVKMTSREGTHKESVLKFILTVEPKEFTVTPSYAFTSGKIKVIVDNKLNVPGEYDVYVNGELIGTTENKEVKWKTENSCTVDLELIHKDESGRYALTNGKQELNIRFPRYLVGSESSLIYSASVAGTTGIAWNYYMGDVITLECTDAEFYAWSLSVGGEKFIPEGLTEEDLKNPVITFTMPDSDVGVSADTKGAFAAGAECSHLCHSENKVLQLFWKLINFFCQLFDIQQYCDCGITHYDAPFFG